MTNLSKMSTKQLTTQLYYSGGKGGAVGMQGFSLGDSQGNCASPFVNKWLHT